MNKNISNCLIIKIIFLVFAIQSCSDDFLEIEANQIVAEAINEEQAIEIAINGADRVMLDNFTPKEATMTIEKLRKISNKEIEISGGITIENIADYAKLADFISLGNLTMASLPVDFSLHVV